MNKWIISIVTSLAVVCGIEFDKINALRIDIQAIQSEIKESRRREELLYKECKNIDYLIDVLTQQYIQEKA